MKRKREKSLFELIRKPMPPPSQYFKNWRKESRQKSKENLKREMRGE